MNRPIPAARIACTIDPQSWDLEEGNYRAGVDAQAECLRCPRLSACRTELETMINAKTPPLSMIWAGIPFNHSGQPILSGTRLRSYYNRVAAHREVHQSRGSAA
ncbi:hypothetical protein [Rhodococcus qingshengii]|uniref:hypothetical protein n=1 Tax=Rhodococcus qingshengii TaxID=334542 RepID=UPI00237CCCAC|nr:hypothetical protein [Rhodococcus qingshengii]WCT06193.1 hypothetical protein PI247_31235 [Rhodococcus qingshengii]